MCSFLMRRACGSFPRRKVLHDNGRDDAEQQSDGAHTDEFIGEIAGVETSNVGATIREKQNKGADGHRTGEQERAPEQGVCIDTQLIQAVAQMFELVCHACPLSVNIIFFYYTA